MRRIFWDAMLLIYMLEDNPTFSGRVRNAFISSLQRGDTLMTSWLAVGELLAGAEKAGTPGSRNAVEDALQRLPFQKLPFGEKSSTAFGQLRRRKVAIADSIHLACAAAAEVDLFLTNDTRLHTLHVPGIKFIAGLESGIV